MPETAARREPPSTSSTRPARRLRAIATLLAASCVTGVLALGLVSGVGLTYAEGDGPVVAGPSGERLTGQVAALRTVPVIEPGGIIEKRFPDGAGLDDPDAVMAAAGEIVAGLGVDESLVWELGWELQQLSATDPTGEYPYSYPGVRAVLEPALASDVVAAHRSDLHELGSLMELAAASSNGSVIAEENPLEWAGAAAYEIWSALATDPADCDAHLDLAALVSFGQLPNAAAVDQLFSDAVAACPDDPTARWLWGHSQSTWGSAYFEALAYVGLTEEEARSRPLEMFREWQADQPGSALPWAGEAEARVSQAEAMQSYGSMPFTARAHAKRALELYELADEVEHDPAFVVGQARALAVLGEWDAAADRLARAVAEEPDDADVHTFYIQVLERAGRFAEAAASARLPDTARIDPTHLSDEVGAIYLDLEPEDAHHVTLRDLAWEDMGGGSVEWVGYVPDWRADGVLWDVARSAWCRGETVLRNEILAGRPEQALESDVVDVEGCGLPGAGRRAVIESPELPGSERDGRAFYLAWARDLATGETPLPFTTPSGVEVTADDYYDDIQNVWRYAGDLERAADSIDEWRRELPDSPWAMRMAGEVAFLDGEYGDAVDAFAEAAAAPTSSEDTTGTAWTGVERAAVTLDLGTALEKDGAVGAAEDAYRAVLTEPEATLDSVDYTTTVAFAHARLGALRLAAGESDDALDDLRVADRMVAEAEGIGTDQTWGAVAGSETAGVDANNLAVALLDAGKEPEEALAAARRALLHDPESPVYLDTTAQAFQANGEPERAVRSYRRALAADPTVYQSWNNLGVLHAELGDHDRARHAFRQAVTVEPGYARGWWNLGVELGKGFGPRDLVASQRALATAIRIDGDLRGSSSGLEPDFSALATGLDLSRAVPADWTFADSAREVTAGLSWVILLVSLLRLALALGLDRLGEQVGVRVLGFARSGSTPSWAVTVLRVWSRIDRYPGLAWAMAGSVLVVGWPLVGSSHGHWLGLVLSAVALLSALWLSLVVAQHRAARAGLLVERRGWGPGMAFGAASALVGYAFVPVPVASDPTVPPRVRWSGPLVLAGVAAAALLVGVVTGGPAIRVVGVGVLAMLSTSLFPLRPFDGGYLHGRRARAVSSAVLVVVSAGLIAGWA